MTVTIPQASFLRSTAMQDAASALSRAVRLTGGVLLSGEPGSGRRLFARAIHHGTYGDYDGSVEHLLRLSMRRVVTGRPFVVIDCSNAVAAERDLLGPPGPAHSNGDSGLETIAEGCAVHRALSGTLVLRHIPELPLRLQLRLARVLGDREVMVRGQSPHPVSVGVSLRVVATMDGTEGGERSIGTCTGGSRR